MKKTIDQNGYKIFDNVFSADEMDQAEKNIIDFANIFRKKLRVESAICNNKIKSKRNLSDFLIWLDNYNNEYLFSFVGLVSQLPKIKKLSVNDTVINLASNLLDIPVNELLSGNISFLVNTPSSLRLIAQWHNAKNYYPKRQLHINFWVPLIIDKTVNNGSLKIAEGSCLNDYPFLEFKGSGDEFGKGALTQNLIPAYFIDPFEIITLKCKVGSSAAILPKTIHSGSMNKTDECSYVLVFKIWANHKDWTLSDNLEIKYFSGDIGAGPDVGIT